MHLSVVIPVRNEAENILPLLAEIHAALEGGGEFEVVYVDDGSSDGTRAWMAAVSMGVTLLLAPGVRVASG